VQEEQHRGVVARDVAIPLQCAAQQRIDHPTSLRALKLEQRIRRLAHGIAVPAPLLRHAERGQVVD
jgi:hypothetical protein